ncbi:MAG: ROK family protein [Acidobacteria bacterium]|nr:ROK family protein [Acidobacteriota bacterium]MBI3424607.1 ROK family protein [Acidobacteriota bacterium]
MTPKTLFIGIDLGGTNIKAALVNTDSGDISGLTATPTHAQEGHDAVIVRMAELAHTVISATGQQKDDIGGIGLGIPGLLDLEHGLTLFLPNLPGQWRSVPVRAELAQASGLPVAIINDARAATLGEWKFGAGRGVESCALYTLGTGIGGGLVINGELYLGIGGAAGELGHVSVDFNGPRCNCGSRGCIEAFASGPAMSAAGMRAVVQGATTKITELCAGDLNLITPELIYQAALAGDEVAREIYEFAGKAIGYGIANVVMALTPRRVLIGGGVAAAGDLILEPIRRTVRDRVRVADKDAIEILPATLGNNAGLMGAAVWARQNVG